MSFWAKWSSILRDLLVVANDKAKKCVLHNTTQILFFEKNLISCKAKNFPRTLLSLDDNDRSGTRSGQQGANDSQFLELLIDGRFAHKIVPHNQGKFFLLGISQKRWGTTSSLYTRLHDVSLNPRSFNFPPPSTPVCYGQSQVRPLLPPLPPSTKCTVQLALKHTPPQRIFCGRVVATNCTGRSTLPGRKLPMITGNTEIFLLLLLWG